MQKITLIIPDIHHKVDQADKIIKHVGADKVICTGDIFDDFGDTPEISRHSAAWLVEFVNNPNHILIAGNHDLHYMYSYRTFKCSGFEQNKYYAINDIIDRSNWDKLKFYHVLDDKWLLTHAGLHKRNVPANLYRNNHKAYLESISNYLDESINDGFKAAANNVPHWIFNAGNSRGGFQEVGGITWCDFDRELFPIKGINQIFGHTPQSNEVAKWCLLNNKNKRIYISHKKWQPTELNNPNFTANIDLDVWENLHYAVWDGNKLEVGNYNALKKTIY